MPTTWMSAYEATSAAWILCTIYTECKGNVPGDLLGYYLNYLKEAHPGVATAFCDHVRNTCPRLMELFAWAK
jgi:hypothetical protein